MRVDGAYAESAAILRDRERVQVQVVRATSSAGFRLVDGSMVSYCVCGHPAHPTQPCTGGTDAVCPCAPTCMGCLNTGTRWVRVYDGTLDEWIKEPTDCRGCDSADQAAAARRRTPGSAAQR